MDSKNFPPSLAQRCWRYMRVLLLAVGFFVFGSQDANATHFAGADLTYECVGNNRYVVTLTLYRDCEGVNMSTQEFINMTSASCGLTPAGVALPRDTFYEVSQLCAPALSNSFCNNPNGPYPGIEVHVYRDTIDFPQACTDWIVSWSSCCRNNAITTLTSTGSIYIEAGINSTLCNSSPTFSSNPTPYFCAGQCYNYNHGAFDPENDSLRYALTCPLQGANNCITNIAGLSPTQPLFTSPGAFQFDPVTGQMTFCTAPGQQQFAVAAVTVYQIVGGDTIGFVQRDIQMIVLNGVNCTSPVGSNDPIVNAGGSFDTTANTFVVCAGETLIFNLVLADPDGDTITINPANTNLDQVFGVGNWTVIMNTAPPFRPDSVQMFVQVVANPTNIGVNNFTIGVTDNACPIPGDQILGYNLIIPGVEVIASDTTICPGIGQQIQMTANSFSSVGALAAGTFSWTQVGGPAITFSNDTIPSPIVNVPSTTQDGDTIVLQVTFITAPDPVTGTQCTTTDEVSIFLRALPLSLNVFASDTSLCPNNQNDTIAFSTSISGPGIDLVNGVYTWAANPSSYLANLTNTTVNNPDAIVSGGPNDSVVYSINYTYGLCVGSDSVKLKWRNGIPDVSAVLDTICPGDTTQLMGFLTDSIIVIDPTACSSYTVAPITFAPVAGSGTSVSLTDDALSGTLPIGFDFEFYCNTYNQFRISSNGYITFDLTTFTSGCCTGQTLPDNGDPNDLIALAWEDLNPSNGGTIEYFTVGTAPNRQLVVNYTNVPRFGGANNVTGQIVLHEGTNLIDVHTTSVLPDGGTTQGIENNDGSVGIAVPGRNSQTWTATNDAYRFTPAAAFLFGPITYNWTPGFAVSDATAYNPNAFPQGTTMFTLEINEKGCVLTDSVEIFVNSQIPVPTITCGTPTNQATSVLFEWGGSTGATGWEYSIDSGITWIPRAYADSSLLITGLTNGDCANILVRAVGGAGPCPTNAATYLECCTTPCPMPTTSTVTNLSCNGSDNGTMTINIDGGVLGDHPSYTATLFDTSGAQIGTPLSTPVNSPDSVVFTGLAAGVYYAYITDTFGCFTNSDTLVIIEPDTLILSLDSTTLTTCFADADGTASVSSVGGTPTYNYLWDVAAGNQTTPTAVGLTRGTYQVTVTDDNGCTDVLSVDVHSPFPAAPSVTVNTTPSGSCAGDGTATVFSTFNMVGNANNYTYQWSNNGSTGPTAVGLASGVTTVTVTDANGCQAISSVTITGSPTVSVTNMVTINPGCGTTTGQITAVATGDSTGYTYQWSANAGGQTSALVTGLGIGTYTVTVTGATNGCTAVGTVNLVNNSALNIVGFNTTNPSCGGADGDITVLTTGAVGTLTYNWTGGQVTNPATGLAAGTYLVTVTDPATGCSDIADTVLVQPTLSASFTSQMNPSCNLSNGSITVTGNVVDGPVGPFTYAWSDGQASATALGLAPGIAYTCTVTYQGCTEVVGPLTLTNDSLQIAITDKDDIICNGDLSSYANVTLITGNPATTTFAWSNSATTQNISGMAAGTYTVTATSGTCTATQSITVVDISLGLNAWIDVPGTRRATIQSNTVIDINGGATTNHANPVYTWTESNPTIVDIADSSAAVTTATGGLTNGESTLYITATAGPCTAVDSVLVIVESYLGMPTAFTPNGDHINDIFQPAGLTASDKVFQFKIYNRWGQLVYNDNVNHYWDGTYQGVAQPQDVYIYVFEYAPQNEDPIVIRGEFTLIR
ncbi:T9SS type B sorting domain-containing protein [Aureispira anguillae]|uniref:Gliding motility-associated C-terminal domain-containing protein n=1 Tax=Aureispira anguillae TaxID=2864201 RepID=A0A915YH98_9BACT|nr:gliding motility-associated C-terminal domain-containing protein [Aureispira anguillae]BDS13157.1 gliding motility-associated C-terminal domain-containing protein [Aureispira anguillae]